MTYITNKNYEIEVSRGNISGVASKGKFGRNLSVATGTDEDMWIQGGLIEWITVAQGVNLTGGAADVMTSGTGAWKVVLEGLDASYNVISETIQLNGASNVASVNSYLRLQRMYISECGSGNVNSGVITATWVTAASVANSIAAGAGQTEYLAFTVPASKEALLSKLYVGSVDDASGGVRAVELYLFMRLYDVASTDNYQSWRRINTIFLNQNGTTQMEVILRSLASVPEKADLRMSVSTTKNGTSVFGRIEYLLYDV